MHEGRLRTRSHARSALQPASAAPAAAFAVLAALATATATAQGVVVVVEPGLQRPPLHAAPVETTSLRVTARIVDGAATTELVQTLQNHTTAQQEATWLLPLPEGATADRFAMTVGGVRTEGEVLDAGRARAIYEDIVRRRRDPGLLEYVGSGLLRARVFPIPPLGQVEVAVRWTELLQPTGGVSQYRFPLRAAYACGGQGPATFALAVDVQSQTPIKTVWSPTSGFDVARTDDHHVRGSIELARGAVPSRDLSVFWGTAEQDFGVSVLAHKTGVDPGYALLLLSPKRDWPQQPQLRRAIHFVIDTSGSMAGPKIEQARAAVQGFLRSLPEGDWFNVVPFSTDARPFFVEPVPATKANVETALARTAELQARGGTNIEGALQVVLQHPTPDCYKQSPPIEIVPIVVFVTDGLPTVGTTDVDALLAQVRQRNTGKARFFAFGVGTDVNTRLLDTMAQETRGDRGYVLPGEDIEVATSALFQKLSGPVMTDLQLLVDGVRVEELEPRVLPDLFVTGQIAVVARYRGEGHTAIRLRGKVGSDVREYVFEATFPAQSAACDWLPTLWAQRRVATLLDAIRLSGAQPELVAEVVRLGKEHGIVTPYTSHLVVEEGQQLANLPALQRLRGDGGPGAVERLRRDWGRAGLPGAATGPTGPTAGAAAGPGATTGSDDFWLGQLQRQAEAEAKEAAKDMTARDETGAAAVQKSADLRRMQFAPAAEVAGGGAVTLLHRRVGDRVFHLVGTTWVDRALTAELAAGVKKVAAFSPEYFELLRTRPHLKDVLAFSTRIVVVDGGQAFEITE